MRPMSTPRPPSEIVDLKSWSGENSKNGSCSGARLVSKFAHGHGLSMAAKTLNPACVPVFGDVAVRPREGLLFHLPPPFVFSA